MAEKENKKLVFKPKTKKEFLEAIKFIKRPILICSIDNFRVFLNHYWIIEDRSNIYVKIYLPGCYMSWREWGLNEKSEINKYFNKFNKLDKKYKRWMTEIFNNEYRYIRDDN